MLHHHSSLPGALPDASNAKILQCKRFLISGVVNGFCSTLTLSGSPLNGNYSTPKVFMADFDSKTKHRGLQVSNSRDGSVGDNWTIFNYMWPLNLRQKKNAAHLMHNAVEFFTAQFSRGVVESDKYSKTCKHVGNPLLTSFCLGWGKQISILINNIQQVNTKARARDRKSTL